MDQTPMAQPKAQGVLGTVWLVAKKTGEDLQRFPIDADRVTIGRYVSSTFKDSMLTE